MSNRKGEAYLLQFILLRNSRFSLIKGLVQSRPIFSNGLQSYSPTQLRTSMYRKSLLHNSTDVRNNEMAPYGHSTIKFTSLITSLYTAFSVILINFLILVIAVLPFSDWLTAHRLQAILPWGIWMPCQILWRSKVLIAKENFCPNI